MLTGIEKFVIRLIQGIDDWADNLPQWKQALITVALMLIAAICIVLVATADAYAGECSVYDESSTLHSGRIPVVQGGAPLPGSKYYASTAISGIHLTGVGRANVCASAQTHIDRDHPLHLYWYIDLHVDGGPSQGALINHGATLAGAAPILYCANLSWEGGDAYAVLHAWARKPPWYIGRQKYLKVTPQGKRMTALMFVDC